MMGERCLGALKLQGRRQSFWGLQMGRDTAGLRRKRRIEEKKKKKRREEQGGQKKKKGEAKKKKTGRKRKGEAENRGKKKPRGRYLVPFQVSSLWIIFFLFLGIVSLDVIDYLFVGIPSVLLIFFLCFFELTPKWCCSALCFVCKHQQENASLSKLCFCSLIVSTSLGLSL